MLVTVPRLTYFNILNILTGKQLNAVGRIELSFQWINTTVLEITFIQLAMTSKKFTGGMYVDLTSVLCDAGIDVCVCKWWVLYML